MEPVTPTGKRTCQIYDRLGKNFAIDCNLVFIPYSVYLSDKLDALDIFLCLCTFIAF